MCVHFTLHITFTIIDRSIVTTKQKKKKQAFKTYHQQKDNKYAKARKQMNKLGQKPALPTYSASMPLYLNQENLI